MGEVIKTMKYDDLPPARAALAALNAEIAGAEAELRTLRSGKAKLDLDLTSVRNTETELAALVDADARDIVSKLKSGVTWVLEQVGGEKAQKIAERLAASKHRAAVAERALTATEGEIAALETRLADLRARKPAYVAAVVKESSGGLFEDSNTLAEQLRETMVHLAALERHLGVNRVGRVVAVLPDFTWQDNLGEAPIVAPEREIRKAQTLFARFAEALDKDPRAPMPELDPIDPVPDENTVYSDLSSVERRHLDVRNANAPLN